MTLLTLSILCPLFVALSWPHELNRERSIIPGDAPRHASRPVSVCKYNSTAAAIFLACAGENRMHYKWQKFVPFHPIHPSIPSPCPVRGTSVHVCSVVLAGQRAVQGLDLQFCILRMTSNFPSVQSDYRACKDILPTTTYIHTME